MRDHLDRWFGGHSQVLAQRLNPVPELQPGQSPAGLLCNLRPWSVVPTTEGSHGTHYFAFAYQYRNFKTRPRCFCGQTEIQWCPDLVYPDLVDCRDLVD